MTFDELNAYSIRGTQYIEDALYDLCVTLFST